MIQPISASTSGLIVVGMRWTDRFIGLISTIILARLLAPDDFGLIAMATLLIGLIDVLLDMGVNLTLVQNKNATQADFDAAWTLRLAQSGLATLIVFAVAYPAAEYFRDARIVPIVQILAVSILIQGLENIGIVMFQKQMEFGQEFKFFIFKRLGGFVITMIAAWYLKSYWALVIGTLSVRVIGVGLSYSMHPMRPSLSLTNMKAMVAFSSWNLLTGIGGYLNGNLHRILVGRREDTAVMGSYTLASDIAAMPSTELLAPLNRVLFPLFVEARDDSQRFKKVFLLAMGVQSIIGIPAGVGLAMVAPELVAVMLGAKWSAATPFVQIMGGINVILALTASAGYVLLAGGRAKINAAQSWCQVLVFVAVVGVVFPQGGGLTIAFARAGVAVAGLFSYVYLIRREHPSWPLLEMFQSVWRPCFAALMMALTLWFLPLPTPLSMTGILFLKTLLGAVVYGLALLGAWWLAGRPDGAESYLLEKVKYFGIASLKRS
jgi:lipopolysaccharide exporter